MTAPMHSTTNATRASVSGSAARTRASVTGLLRVALSTGKK